MAKQNPEVANARGIPKQGRYGGQTGSYLLYKKGLTADESVPTAHLQGTVVGARFEECRWVIKLVGFTSADVHFMRWVAALDNSGNELPGGEGFWVEEDTITITEHHIHDQYVNDDRLACYVDGLVGAGTVSILRKGVTKHA